MTALASWCAWDQHGHSAIYLTADSLITWDDGRHSLEPKLFAQGTEPQIVGYCGDRDWGVDLCKQVLRSVSTNVAVDVFANSVLHVLATRAATLPRALHRSSEVIHVARVQVHFPELAHRL